MFHFNRDLGIIVSVAGGQSPLKSVTHKRGDQSRLKVVFTRGGVGESLVGEYQIHYVIKTEPGEDVPAMALASAWTEVEDEPGAYVADLNTNTEILNELLEGLTRKSFYSEITFTDENGGPTTSQLLLATVENDLYRGDEDTPAQLPDPAAWAPLASPAFTGIPTAPTAAAGTSTTQLATTAFVAAALAPLILSEPPDNDGVRVTGTLTSDGTTPANFPDLFDAGEFDGFPSWSDDGTPPANDDSSAVYHSGSTWVAQNSGVGWVSTAEVNSPFLVPAGAWHATTNPDAWFPASGNNTGTPVVTAIGTAGILGQHAIVDETDVYACVRETPVKWVQLS